MATTHRNALHSIFALVFLVAGSCANTHAQSPTPTPQPAPTQSSANTDESKLPTHQYTDPLEDPIVLHPHATAPDANLTTKPESPLPACEGKACAKGKTAAVKFKPSAKPNATN